MGNFQKLQVWQFAKDLAVKIYMITKSQSYLRDHGLREQIQRAAISVPANISEGDESGTNKQSVRYFHIAKGSLAELQTMLIISSEINYIDKETRDSLVDECNIISIMLTKLIRARNP
jgi:four helix bundle protein